MTSSPDLIHELRASRPSAPAELRARIRAIAAERTCPRSVGELALSRSAAGCSSRFRPQRRSRSRAQASSGSRAPTRRRPSARTHSRSRRSRRRRRTASDAGATRATGRSRPERRPTTTTADRAQHVSATLTVEVKDSDAVSRAAQSALDLTRTLGGFVVSSSVATGDEGSASITVRVPVDEVQDAITGLSGLGRIVSQQVTTADRQESIDAAQSADALAPRADRARHRPARVRGRSTPRRRRVSKRGSKNLKTDLLVARRNLGALRAEARMSTDPAHRRHARRVRRGRSRLRGSTARSTRR